jgi:hypothetical protein
VVFHQRIQQLFDPINVNEWENERGQDEQQERFQKQAFIQSYQFGSET